MTAVLCVVASLVLLGVGALLLGWVLYVLGRQYRGDMSRSSNEVKE